MRRCGILFCVSSFRALPTRRERLRAQTLDEIASHAMVIVDSDGADALTLASIAKSMGMSAPGLYRYFPSRDALLDELLLDAHRQLAAALEARSTKSADLPQRDRIYAIVDEYRAWALTHPKRYEMMFVDRSSSGRYGEETLAVANRGMEVLIGTLAGLDGPEEADAIADELEAQLRDWSVQRDNDPVSAHNLRLAIFTWTRLHGIVSLEISGTFAAIGVDPRLLIEAEIESVLTGTRPAEP
jgi:AcrR family transcriptional regulator